MEIIKTKQGETIHIEDAPFASGGEGRVHKIVSPAKYQNFCVKIYFDCVNPKKKVPQKIKEREEKIEFMVKNKPQKLEDSTWRICWPNELVYVENEFVGFIMPLAFENSVELFQLTNLKINQDLQFDWSKFDRENPEGIKRRFKLNSNIALAVHNLHENQKYVVVDMKPQNFLVAPDGKVSILDVDTIQISNNENVLYPSKAMTAEYLPPESANIKGDKIEVSWDRFILSVIFYELLFGIHPFTGAFEPPYDNFNTLRDRIENGLFPFGKKENYFKGVPKQHFYFRKTPEQLQHLFVDTFEHGLKNAHDRPSAATWGETFFDCVKSDAISAQPNLSNSTKAKTINVPTNTSTPPKPQNNSIQTNNKNNGLLVGLIISIVIALGLLIFAVNTVQERDHFKRQYNYERDSKTEYKDKAENSDIIINEKEQEISQLKNLISDFGSKNPIEISDIMFANINNSNTIDDYGNPLNARGLRYLFSKIYYNSYLETGKSITVYFKIINPDGSLKTGSDSPSGYSFSSSIHISGSYLKGQTSVLSGWGNASTSVYSSGTYRYEIWYYGKCIGTETFYIN